MARSKKDLPFDKVKVGYADIKINAIDGRDAERREIFGEYFMKSQEIDYDNSLEGSEKVNTLIHELNHAIVHVFGIKFHSNECEETIVNSMSNGITTLLKDNKELYDWIGSVLYEDDE